LIEDQGLFRKEFLWDFGLFECFCFYFI